MPFATDTQVNMTSKLECRDQVRSGDKHGRSTTDIDRAYYVYFTALYPPLLYFSPVLDDVIANIYITVSVVLPSPSGLPFNQLNWAKDGVDLYCWFLFIIMTTKQQSPIYS